MNNPEGGTPFTNPEGPNNQPGQQQPQRKVSEQFNNLLKDERVQQAQAVGKQYWSYYLRVLTRPYTTMKEIPAAHFMNSVITLGLTALLTALYFLILFIKWDVPAIFGPGFIKPLLLTAAGLAVACGAVYAILRVEKASFDPKLLITRLGTLLVPAVALQVLAILFLLFTLYSFSTTLLALSFLFVFISMNTVLFQYPLNTAGSRGIDTLYLIAIANIATGYIFYKLITSVVAGAAYGLISNSFNF